MLNHLILWVIEEKNQLNQSMKNFPTLMKDKEGKPKDLIIKMKPSRPNLEER